MVECVSSPANGLYGNNFSRVTIKVRVHTHNYLRKSISRFKQWWIWVERPKATTTVTRATSRIQATSPLTQPHFPRSNQSRLMRPNPPRLKPPLSLHHRANRRARPFKTRKASLVSKLRAAANHPDSTRAIQTLAFRMRTIRMVMTRQIMARKVWDGLLLITIQVRMANWPCK